MKEAVFGIFMRNGKHREYYTKSISPGVRLFDYGESRKEGDDEYRKVDPERSKLCAAVAKGMQHTGIRKGSVVLYLGASHGYTPSFVSDMVGTEGFVFALDFAPRVVRDLVFVCEKRENMAPLLADAHNPEEYASKVPKVDIVYQDIAARDQLSIFRKNCEKFLKQGGYGLLAVKARSIDVTKHPKEIFKRVRKEIETAEGFKGYVIVDYRELQPYEKDHAMFVVKRR